MDSTIIFRFFERNKIYNKRTEVTFAVICVGRIHEINFFFFSSIVYTLFCFEKVFRVGIHSAIEHSFFMSKCINRTKNSKHAMFFFSFPASKKKIHLIKHEMSKSC